MTEELKPPIDANVENAPAVSGEQAVPAPEPAPPRDAEAPPEEPSSAPAESQTASPLAESQTASPLAEPPAPAPTDDAATGELPAPAAEPATPAQPVEPPLPAPVEPPPSSPPPAQDEAAAAAAAAEQEARKAFAAESGRQRQALFDRLSEVLQSCVDALAEPGKTSLRALARHERDLRGFRNTLYQSKLTRRDWNLTRQAYQAATNDLEQRKEQASLAARGYIQSQTDEILVLLKAEGPNAALARLKEVQRERGQCLLSKADWDEVERILESAYAQIREAGRLLSPWYQRLEAQARQARQFAGRLERQAAWLRSRITDSRRQWEVEGNALRAALLKQQFTDGEVELEQLTVKLADVRKQAEQLEARLQRKSRPDSKTASSPAESKTTTPAAESKTASSPAESKTVTPTAKSKSADPPADAKTATPPAAPGERGLDSRPESS